MKYKQITLEQALKRYNGGKDVNILIPGTDWNDYCPSTMSKLLGGILCFVPESEKCDSGKRK